MPSPFVLDGILTTSGDGSSGGDVTVPINYVTDNNQGTIFTFSPDPSVDTESSPFRFTALSFTNGNGSQNFVTRMGHNVAPGGGPLDALRPMLAIEQEQRYHDGSQYASEFHISYQRPGGTLQRWFTAFLSADAPTRANNVLGFGIEQVYHNDVSGNRIFTSDRTDGFLVNNTRIAIGITAAGAGGNPASDGYVVAAPSDYTGKFLKLSRNGFEFATWTPYGELVINGSATGLNVAGTSADAMLEITGRTQTPNIVNFRSVNGTERFRITATGTQAVFNASVGHYFLKDLFVMDPTFTDIKFAAIGNGQIWTNQTTAASALGAIAKVWPIYNETGVLQGYVPLYATFTP